MLALHYLQDARDNEKDPLIRAAIDMAIGTMINAEDIYKPYFIKACERFEDERKKA